MNTMKGTGTISARGHACFRRVASRSTRKPFVDAVLDPTQLLLCTFKHINMSLSEKTEEEERVLKDISSKLLASMERASRVYYL